MILLLQVAVLFEGHDDLNEASKTWIHKNQEEPNRRNRGRKTQVFKAVKEMKEALKIPTKTRRGSATNYCHEKWIP